MEDSVFQISEQLLEKALEVPFVNTNPLPDYGYEMLDYGMTLGIEYSPGGRLWAAWIGGGDNEKAFVVVARSEDKGESWSDPVLVIDPHDESLPCARSSLVGNLWTDPIGRLWLFFDQSLANFDGRAGDWYTLSDDPNAANVTWTVPVRIWHGMTLNKPTVLDSGEWLLPISLWTRDKIDRRFVECHKELDDFRMANVFSSKDQGTTWVRKGGVTFPLSDFDEHIIVQLMDGRLWMLARTRDNTGSIWESFSDDDGINWTQPRQSKIRHLNTRFNIRRLKSGRLLLIKHGQEIDTITKRRSHLTAYLSENDGTTWSWRLLLDEREEVSYPDSVQDDEGTIYVSYDRNRNTDGDILLARFTEEDILNGKCTGQQSRLRMLISRPMKNR